MSPRMSLPHASALTIQNLSVAQSEACIVPRGVSAERQIQVTIGGADDTARTVAATVSFEFVTAGICNASHNIVFSTFIQQLMNVKMKQLR